MPFEMPVFSKDENKKKKLGAAGAALVGALSQSPEALAEEDVENHENGRPAVTATVGTFEAGEKLNTSDAKKQSIANEYAAGKRLPSEAGDGQVERLTREGKDRKEASFLSSSEQKYNTGLAGTREALGLDEALMETRKVLNLALNKITQEVGTSVRPVVSVVGGWVIDKAIKKLDSRVSGMISQALVQDMPASEAQTLAFVHSKNNAENMPGKIEFTKTLGGAEWKVTVGIDPGLTGLALGEKINPKLSPRVGVTFRLAMP